MSATEVRLYRQSLKEAQKHLVRLVKLGKRLKKTDSPAWQVEVKFRREAVKQLRTLLQLVEKSSKQ